MKGLESYNEKRKSSLCNERDVQSSNFDEEIGDIRHEWTKTASQVAAPVSHFITNFCRFLVNIKYAFQDRENLYLISDLLTGGNFRFHIGKKKRFNEDEMRFMMGLSNPWPRIHALAVSHPSCYEARKHNHGRKRLFANHRLWNFKMWR